MPLLESSDTAYFLAKSDRMLRISTFFLLISHAFSMNFSFTSFQPNDYSMISWELSAYIAESHLYLVRNQKELSSDNSQGRATYQGPMPLWDKATGKLDGWLISQEADQIRLSSATIFGFSAATGTSVVVHKVDTWSFYSEDFPRIAPSTGRNATALAIGLGVGGFVLVCLVVLFFLWKYKKKIEDGESNDDISHDDFEAGTGPKKYSYAELASAVDNFKDEQKLGQGGFGGVYRGFLKDSNSYVAIKRISKDSKQGKKEFASEVRTTSQLRHRNLVQLIGCCHERKEMLLVYEYMPNGSLASHLFDDKRFLTWSIRFKIAQGFPSALLYLHEEWEQCVVHRDIKSSNITLDSNFNAKLGDFGLARLVDHAKGAQTTALAGTMGYMAPECITTGRASKESDLYSLGVVALELVCGRKPLNHRVPEDEINIVNWAWDLYGSGRILEAVDPRLQGDFDHNQVERLMIVGLWCAHPDHNHRPSIRQAIHVLNFETPFPSLPSS
ncbi:L-type lectin-domain containing receptor kinase IX.1-like [Neltuma alba]|uniref:L-type lectin-domain containing receptor kinase IX.1-like n=1 Tax=Neltuma alba TaxID=207710 RepID=UPI0010A4D5A1|nr:L-type lectin-domain containing receptor kinase IX.1-like [Prosopis alba]